MGRSEPLSTALRGKGWYALASLAVLAPCYWQSRLQAGDLSSHVYNAWLAQLIERGHAEGLILAHQTTNILFDLLLSLFLACFGAEAAQRIAVSLAVLTFVWGAFAFITKVAGKRPWHLMPILSMWAYGWVFHVGFFNFYLSLGLCFWAAAVAWEFRVRDLLFAAPLLTIAYAAHALPVIWIGGLLTYLYLARPLSPGRRMLLSAGCIAALYLLHLLLAHMMVTRWSPAQLTLATGLDQVWVFDSKYHAVLMGLIALGGLLLIGLVRADGARRVTGSISFQFCVISAAAVVILPGTLQIPGYNHALSYISERMSLGVAVCVCAMLCAARPRMLERGMIALVALAFFGLVYIDERALNSFEDRMQTAVSTLPPGERVVSPIMDSNMRINALAHMVDRVCIGHCFSYGNYEASTGQFRVRATKRNGIVASSYADAWRLQTGEYIVSERDLPLFKLNLDGDGRIFLEALKAGHRSGSSSWKTLPNLQPIS